MVPQGRFIFDGTKESRESDSFFGSSAEYQWVTCSRRHLILLQSIMLKTRLGAALILSLHTIRSSLCKLAARHIEVQPLVGLQRQ